MEIISESQLQDKLEELQNIILARRDIPKKFEKNLLLRYLKFYNGNTERALKRLMACIEIRNSYSNIFFKRDTLSSELRKLIDQVEMFLMPKLTAQNNRIMIIRLIDFEPDSIVFEDALSVFSMVYDTTMLTPDDSENKKFANGEILIFDLNGLTPRHLTRLGFSSLRCFFRYMAEAHPMRIKQIHLINCSSMLDKLVMLIRPFLASKAIEAMHFHPPNTTTLFEFVPRDLLLIELGGTGGSLDGPKWYWIRETENHREYLLDDEMWMCNDKNVSTEDSFKYMGFC